MKIKIADLRKLIREYSRDIQPVHIEEICNFAMKMSPDDAAKYCRDKLEHHFIAHINSTSESQANMHYKIKKMVNVLAALEREIKELSDLKKDLKDSVNRHVGFFLYV